MINIMDTEYLFLLIGVLTIGYLLGNLFGFRVGKQNKDAESLINKYNDKILKLECDREDLIQENGELRNEIHRLASTAVEAPTSPYKYKEWDSVLETLRDELTDEEITLDYYIEKRAEILVAQREEELDEATQINTIKTLLEC